VKHSAGLSFIGTFSLTLLAIAGLFTGDTFLAAVDRKESDVEAARLFSEGQVLISKGDNAKAIDRLNDAIAIERGNRVYLRTLAEAQLATGKTADAEKTADDLLDSEPTDGEASLLMARALTKEGRYPDAISYFHRAVYGRWDQDEEGNRRRARAELIDLLARRNSKEELLAELLAVQAAPQDNKARLQLGELFLQAGSPARALDVFRNVLRSEPENAAAYQGLGDAEFSQGNYRLAQRHLQTAMRLAPDDATIRRRLEVCNQLLELDPMLRGLPAGERYSRSLKLVDLTLGEVNQCQAQVPPADLQPLVDRANAALKARINEAHQGDASEANLDIAEQLWQVRKKEECSAPADPNRPLALVLARLTQ
jgi:tetratricopeptide (TPR) repeat protein